MRRQIEILGFRIEIRAERISKLTAELLVPVLAFALLVMGLTLFFLNFARLIFPALSVLIALKIFEVFKTVKFEKLNDFNSTRRPYSVKDADESVPIIEIDKLRREEREKEEDQQRQKKDSDEST